MSGTVNLREISARSSMVSTFAIRHQLSFVYVFFQLLFSLVTDLAIRAKSTGWQAGMIEDVHARHFSPTNFTVHYYMHVI
jgi:hypothetical protein